VYTIQTVVSKFVRHRNILNFFFIWTVYSEKSQPIFTLMVSINPCKIHLTTSVCTHIFISEKFALFL